MVTGIKYHWKGLRLIIETEYVVEDICEAHYWSLYKSIDFSGIVAGIALGILFASAICSG